MTVTLNLRSVEPKHLVMVVVLLLLVGLSRAMVFPASVWEQDEAYFAAAVVEIDIGDSRPHAPFFPLWIAIGKVLYYLGLPPAVALQLASAVFGSLIVIPLIALWRRCLGPGLSVAAAVLVLTVPGVWLLSARAFSGTAATALMIASLACWTRPEPGRWVLAAGSTAAGLAVLIRPHFGVVEAAIAVVVLARVGWRRWAEVVLPAAALIFIGFGVFVCAAGGPAAVGDALSRHAGGHFGALSAATLNLFDSGLARVFVHPAVLVLWLFLAVAGAAASLRTREDRDVTVPVLVALIALLILVFGLSNPAHPRYAIPLVVLSGGLVVDGLRRLAGDRWTSAIVAAAALGAAAAVLSVSQELRRVPSPPMRALERADVLAEGRGAMVVVDRGLHSFVLHGQMVGALTAEIVFDHVFELGGQPPPPDQTVMVFDLGQDGRVIANEEVEDFSCDRWLLRRLSQDRFLEIRVVDGAVLSRR